MLQDLHQVSANPNYPLGMKYPGLDPADQRVFRYSRTIAAITLVYRLNVIGLSYLATSEMLTAAPAAAAGAKSLVAITTLYPGLAGAGIVGKDELKGGFIEIFPTVGTNPFMWRKITGNSANVGANTVIYVDKPFDLAVAVGSQVGLHPNIYRDIVPAASGVANYKVAVGLAPVLVPLVTPFHWEQTKGPCWIAATGGQPLAAARYVDVYMHEDGTINSSVGEVIGTTISPQRIGYVLGGAQYGCNQIMLQLE